MATAFFLFGLEGIREGLTLNKPYIFYEVLAYLALGITLPYAVTAYGRHRTSLPPRATAFTPANVLFPGSSLIFPPANLALSWAALFRQAISRNELILTVPLWGERLGDFATESSVRWNGTMYFIEGVRRVRLLKLSRKAPGLYLADYQPLTDQAGSVDRAYLSDLAKTFVGWAQQFPELSWSIGVASETDPSNVANTICHAVFYRRPDAGWLLGVDNLTERANAVARELAQFGFPVVPTAPVRPVVVQTPAKVDRQPEPTVTGDISAIDAGLPASRSRGVPALDIFISYRRNDSSIQAQWLVETLAERFGRNRVFMDTDTIEPGVDFLEVIDGAVGHCDVLIALIGPQWLGSADAEGRRLDNPGDFVRHEIETALDRNIRVIPALVGGATMPRSDELPGALANLARRNAVELSDMRFRGDMQSLLERLERIAQQKGN